MNKEACGVVIVCNDEYLLVKKPLSTGGHWDFPKGSKEENETDEETAKREVLEETGIKVRLLDGFKEKVQYYPVPGFLRTVYWFVGFTENKKVKLQEKELEEYAWLPFDKALKQLTFENGKQILTKAHEFLQD